MALPDDILLENIKVNHISNSVYYKKNQNGQNYLQFVAMLAIAREFSCPWVIHVFQFCLLKNSKYKILGYIFHFYKRIAVINKSDIHTYWQIRETQ